MQQFVSRPGPGGHSRSQTIIIVAVTLFALAGLLSGFTVGAMTLQKKPQQATNPTSGQPIAIHQNDPTPTKKVEKKPLGCPIIQGDLVNGGTITADGETTHTFSAQAAARPGGNNSCLPERTALESPGITCRLWLAKEAPKSAAISAYAGNIENLKTKPADGEITDALLFDEKTPQTQPCDEKGLAKWDFKFSPEISAGKYILVALTDWDGAHANWSWSGPITIKKG